MESSYSVLIEKQRRFFSTNQTKNIGFRIQALKQLKKNLSKQENALYQAIYTDIRKSEFECYMTELSLIYHEIDLTCRKLKKWAAPQKVKTNLFNLPAKSYIISEPLGCTLIIGAWNYPFQLTLIPLISSIAAGNTVILKPSELASESSSCIRRLIETTFSPEHVTVIEGGVKETQSLLELRFDHIFFTGSTQTGKRIYEAAAKHLTPVTLELGGKSPAIISDSCQLKTTVKRLVWAKFLNSGQTCIAPDYVYVSKKIEADFIELIVQEINSRNYSIENGNLTRIISPIHTRRLKELIPQHKVVLGGKTDENSCFCEPTVLKEISWEDKLMQTEIFGPILPILVYDDYNELIQLLQNKEKPLASYLFSTDKTEQELFLQHLSFGNGAINDAIMQIGNSQLPFGGVGQSGIGSYHGKKGFDTFSHQKSILHKRMTIESSIKYSPYTLRKLKWIKRLTPWN